MKNILLLSSSLSICFMLSSCTKFEIRGFENDIIEKKIEFDNISYFDVHYRGTNTKKSIIPIFLRSNNIQAPFQVMLKISLKNPEFKYHLVHINELKIIYKSGREVNQIAKTLTINTDNSNGSLVETEQGSYRIYSDDIVDFNVIYPNAIDKNEDFTLLLNGYLETSTGRKNHFSFITESKLFFNERTDLPFAGA